MDEVEEIKHRLDLVEFISQYISLNKAGANYKGLCPFHHERTASLMVSADKQIYKCFGCGEGGDIFQFLMKMESLEFPEALEILAQRAGVTLVRRQDKKVYLEEKNLKTKLYKINDLSARAYHKILLESKEAKPARDYLMKRKISSATIREFLLGYAPRKPIMENFLLKKGFTNQELALAGNPQKFSERIIFPIFDNMGNIVGFTARVLDAHREPKYLNTPETAIYHKGRILYGLNLAKYAIKQANYQIIVEGQMDVILSHQSGIKNTVASSGTALTKDHLYTLSRYSPNIIFAFDADNAGQIAQKKALQMAIMVGLNTKMVIFPEGVKDTGDVVAEDPQKWVELVAHPMGAIEWLFQKAFFNKKDLTGGVKKEIAKELLPFVKIIPDKIEQAHWIKMLAQKLDVPQATINDALEKVKGSDNREKITAAVASQKPITPEDNLIGLILAFSNYAKLVIKELDYQDFSANSFCQEIYKFLQSCYTKDDCFVNHGKNDCHKSQIISCMEKNFSAEIVGRVKLLLLEIENRYKNSAPEAVEEDILKTAKRIRETKIENIKKNCALAIKEAEMQGDRAQVKKLIREFQNAIGKK